ncbi:hypothetical protein Syun_016559 [Stephania yunnanensis]|uniref:Uncharacterized protein n=1 Tax=Stephania yunnanensis TaxID=152371 RepID=A0AAP0P1L7_9MAGN
MRYLYNCESIVTNTLVYISLDNLLTNSTTSATLISHTYILITYTFDLSFTQWFMLTTHNYKPNTIVILFNKKPFKKNKKNQKMLTYKEKGAVDSGVGFGLGKQVHPDIGISDKALGIMNSFINDIFEKLSGEASKLARSTPSPLARSRLPSEDNHGGH